MKDENKRLLEEDGWHIECESPFEIRHETGSFASGLAAEYVLELLVKYNEEWLEIGEDIKKLNKEYREMKGEIPDEDC